MPAAIGFASYNKKNQPIGRSLAIAVIALRPGNASLGEDTLTLEAGKKFKQYLKLTHQKKLGTSAIWQ